MNAAGTGRYIAALQLVSASLKTTQFLAVGCVLASCAQVDELQQSHQSEAKRRAVLESSLRETQAAHKRALYNKQTEVGAPHGQSGSRPDLVS